jgi:hypothetical protein
MYIMAFPKEKEINSMIAHEPRRWRLARVQSHGSVPDETDYRQDLLSHLWVLGNVPDE